MKIIGSRSAGSMPNLYIDGQAVPGSGQQGVVENPSDQTIVTTFPGASLEQVGAAIAAADRANRSGVWSDRPSSERAECLMRMVRWFEENRRQIEDLLVAEAGVVRASVVRAGQLDVALRHATDLAGLFPRLPEIEDIPLPTSERFTGAGTIQSFRSYEPVGVVAAISAYNFPFLIGMWKTISALVTGNCVILRPSPLTPLSTLIFGEAAHAAGLPAGVLNVVAEGNAEGAVLLSTHPAVDMVSFTGSTEIGQHLMRQAADTMKRLQLELGGKSALIYMPDALNLAEAGNRVCVPHSGQVCVAGTRILVPQSAKRKALEAIAASLSAVRIGPADEPTTIMGPLISDAAVARCERFVAEAVSAGARLVCGGRRPPHMTRGHYYEPTILDVEDTENPAMREEAFGPIACVTGYRDVDHAVGIANDSRFGLSGHVFGKDVRAAVAVAARLRTGTVNVNGSALSAYVSGGGRRLSGMGRERGVEGLRIYQEMKCINVVT